MAFGEIPPWTQKYFSFTMHDKGRASKASIISK
jgi:hypothetical protein